MSKIKECFVSRYPGGVLMEADFSQLEVIGLALLSNDPVLKSDILAGLDMHRIRAAELFGVAESAVTTGQRFLAKRLSFQLQYGAGAGSMAAKNKITVALAKKFIDLYYSRYSRVKQWQEEVAKEVVESREPSGRRTASGMPAGVGTYVSYTGRIYKFVEYDAPEWAPERDASFSPTEMKNYMVQGFATADIMAVFRRNLYNMLYRNVLNTRILLINTVHDSVMLDVPALNIPQAEGILKDAASSLPKDLEKLWGIAVDLPLNINIKTGARWSDL